jgi:cation transporter-like permease
MARLLGLKPRRTVHEHMAALRIAALAAAAANTAMGQAIGLSFRDIAFGLDPDGVAPPVIIAAHHGT